MQDEGFHLRIPSQEAKAALNSATSLCKWFDSDQAKDMVARGVQQGTENFFEGMHPECSAARQWCGHSALVVVIPSPAFTANWTHANWEV